MKLINMFVLFLSMLTFISCKTNYSTEEAVGMPTGGNHYALLAKTMSGNNYEVVCKFDCDLSLYTSRGISALEDLSIRSRVCSNPKYIREYDLSKENTYVKSWLDKKFLEVNGRVLKVNLTQAQISEIVKKFDDIGEYSYIGKADVVCSKAIGEEYNGGLMIEMAQQDSTKNSDGEWEQVSRDDVVKKIEEIKKYEPYDGYSVYNKDGNYYYDKKYKKNWWVFSSTQITRNEAVNKCKEKGYVIPRYLALYAFLNHGGDKLFEKGYNIFTSSYSKIDSITSSYNGDIVLHVTSSGIDYAFQDDRNSYTGYVACVEKE